VLAHRPDPDDASAQIDLIGVPWMIVSQEPSAVPNGGSARCYLAVFVPSTALASPGYDGQPAVYLHIAALEVNVLKCRGQGQTSRAWRET
jgi:hypothetical protein